MSERNDHLMGQRLGGGDLETEREIKDDGMSTWELWS